MNSVAITRLQDKQPQFEIMNAIPIFLENVNIIYAAFVLDL